MDEKTSTAGKNCFGFQMKSALKPPPADWRKLQSTNVHLLVLLNYLGVLEPSSQGRTALWSLPREEQTAQWFPDLIWFLLVHAEAGLPVRDGGGGSSQREMVFAQHFPPQVPKILYPPQHGSPIHHCGFRNFQTPFLRALPAARFL